MIALAGFSFKSWAKFFDYDGYPDFNRLKLNSLDDLRKA